MRSMLNATFHGAVVLAVILVLTACPGKSSTPPASLDELVDQQVGYLVRANRIMGASVAVVVDGKVSTYHFGKTQRWPGGTLPNNHTVYEIGSITKTFTSTLLAMMVKEGVVTLETPVKDLFPEGTAMPAYGDRVIQLADLSSHVSGLPGLPDNLGMHPHDPYALYTMDDLYAFLRSAKLNAEPGTQYAYSNLGTTILGLGLAMRAGIAYDQLLHDRILAPLGMTDTTLALTESQRARFAAAYKVFPISGLGISPLKGDNWDLGIFAPAGAIKSTLGDMICYLEASMDPAGTVLEPVAGLLHTARINAMEGVDVALAWHIITAKDGHPDIIWHNGGTGGYSTFLGFFRDSQTGVILLANTAISGEVDHAAMEILKGIGKLPAN